MRISANPPVNPWAGLTTRQHTYISVRLGVMMLPVGGLSPNKPSARG